MVKKTEKFFYDYLDDKRLDFAIKKETRKLAKGEVTKEQFIKALDKLKDARKSRS